jgi:restriction endonuclease Mrr
MISARWWQLHHAVYSEIALNSLTLRIEQLRAHLARFWDERKSISAQQAEDLVASVLRDYYGGDVLRVTANANAPDGGIDLFIVSKDGLVSRAVQVKRRLAREAESVQDVRNFIGAMLLSGVSNGVFVTTAERFSKNAADVESNRNLTKHRLSLELIDGERLLELLDFTNRQRPAQLPPLMNPDQEWVDKNGRRASTYELLFGNLTRFS